MITFYRVRAELDEYQYFLVKELEFWRRAPFDGRPLRRGWRAPAVRIFKPRLLRGAFYGLMGGGGASFVVRADALATGHLSVLLERAGELLPLEYEGEQFFILNITECIDALDSARSAWHEPIPWSEAELAAFDEVTRRSLVQDDEPPRLAVPAFDQNRLGWQLFKIPETAMTEIYYWERSEDGPDEQFRSYCEREGLDGLGFEVIYSTESAW